MNEYNISYTIIGGECIKTIIEDMNRQKKIMKEHLLKLEDKNG